MRIYLTILRSICVGACLLCTVPAYAVQPDPILEPWRWRTFPELIGLGLKCLAEDRAGSMWFGVDDGIRVYKWHDLDSPHTEILSRVVDGVSPERMNKDRIVG